MNIKRGVGSSPDFLDSLIVLLVSVGLALFLLWATSRTQRIVAFEDLPQWLHDFFSSIWTSIAAGSAGIGLAVVKALKRNPTGSRPNYMLWILGTTVIILLLIFLLPRMFKAPEPPAVTRSPLESTPVPPPPTLHTEDREGNQYVITWEVDPACQHFQPDSNHRCTFTHTQTSFAGDNTRYDHWDISLKAPGPVSEVSCQATGSNEFNEVKGDTRGELEGEWARCRGWINGGDSNIRLTAHYQRLW